MGRFSPPPLPSLPPVFLLPYISASCRVSKLPPQLRQSYRSTYTPHKGWAWVPVLCKYFSARALTILDLNCKMQVVEWICQELSHLFPTTRESLNFTPFPMLHKRRSYPIVSTVTYKISAKLWNSQCNVSYSSYFHITVQFLQYYFSRVLYYESLLHPTLHLGFSRLTDTSRLPQQIPLHRLLKQCSSQWVFYCLT